MIDITNLTSSISAFVISNKDTSLPPLLDPSLQEITTILENFKQKPNIFPIITKLAKYCAFYVNYYLAHQLLDWGLQLYPNQHQCHYFKAVLYFKQQDISKTLLSIKNMLHSIKASETQITHILNRLNDENKKNDCIFFIDSLLREFNLPLTSRDFNIFILPYSLSHKDEVVTYYYSVFLVMFCNTLEWIDHGQLTLLLQAEYELNGSSPWYHLCMGRLSWILNNRQQTDFHFKKAKKLSIEQKLIFTTGDCGVYTWLSDEEIQNLPELQAHQDPFQLKMW